VTDRIFYAADTSPDLIRSCVVAMIGYGSQGQAHALNLRDSGVEVRVGQRPGGRGWQAALDDGFRPLTVAAAVEGADVVCLMLPDERHGAVFEAEIRPSLKPGATLMACHGFSFHYGLVHAPAGSYRLLVAPKGQGAMVRGEFLKGGGVPALVAVDPEAPDAVFQLGLSYATALGSAHAGIIRTTIAAETETDLFGEQAVLCGGLTALVQAGFETLVDAGYQPELAYFECLHELKIIADLLHARGIAGMRDAISSTAEFGDLTRGPRVIDDHVRQTLRTILAEIRSGQFAREFLNAARADSPTRSASSLIESTGQRLRGMMPWLKTGGVTGLPAV
jgi:ketol-acid reductoisomerase